MSESYLSVGLRLGDRKCLIVGGGAVAYRKAKFLAEKGAELTVITLEYNAGIEQLAEEKRLAIIERAYESPEAENYGLVIAATSDEEVNQTVYEDCCGIGNGKRTLPAPSVPAPPTYYGGSPDSCF
ncbi:bifunctional precorrin-2 dehydrogenase/sirohydrochlorin ferrochelatase [Candidatus Zixiibacteriota bacterium]